VELSGLAVGSEGREACLVATKVAAKLGSEWGEVDKFSK